MTKTTKSSIRTYCGLIGVILQIVVGVFVIWFDHIQLSHK